jgi:dCMP deaminase
MERPTWDEYFMLLAKLAAIRSTCLSRVVGAVIVVDKQVIATGYNGSVPGAPHCFDEGICYKRSKGAGSGNYLMSRAVHAEANAIGMAARQGISVKGGIMYITLAPCANCVKLLASAGIKEVVYERPYDTEEGEVSEDWLQALDMARISHRQLTITKSTAQKACSLIGTDTSLRHPLTPEGYPVEQ